MYPRIFLSSYDDVMTGLQEHNPDVLIALDSVSHRVWNIWEKELYAIPVADYGTLPIRVAQNKTDIFAGRYKVEPKTKFMIFCAGGHGRTGYFASLFLGKLGVKDPVGYIRQNYCKKAVESLEQLKQISEILKDDTIYTTYKSTIHEWDYSYPYKRMGFSNHDNYGRYSDDFDDYGYSSQWNDWAKTDNKKYGGGNTVTGSYEEVKFHKCGDCIHYYNSRCELLDTFARGNDVIACKRFKDYETAIEEQIQNDSKEVANVDGYNSWI